MARKHSFIFMLFRKELASSGRDFMGTVNSFAQISLDILAEV